MEYIREMLLRQRTALARLMLGGAAEEPSETASAPAADRQEAAAPAERRGGGSDRLPARGIPPGPQPQALSRIRDTG